MRKRDLVKKALLSADWITSGYAVAEGGDNYDVVPEGEYKYRGLWKSLGDFVVGDEVVQRTPKGERVDTPAQERGLKLW